MRRWNGWGNDTFSYPLPEAALTFLEKAVGPGVVTPDATLEEVRQECAMRAGTACPTGSR
jgi:hypothetical protein